MADIIFKTSHRANVEEKLKRILHLHSSLFPDPSSAEVSINARSSYSLADRRS